MIQTYLFILSILLFISIWVGKIGSRLGVPALLLFLIVGMIFGVDGVGIEFSNYNLAEALGTVALCMILFSGGLNTKFQDIKPVIGQSIVLATFGVLLTAFLTGLFTWWLCEEWMPSLAISLLTALLLGSIMSSTDSAAVFAILGSKNMSLKDNLRPTLEFESGSNDPMAYMLTITFISLIQAGTHPNIPLIIFSIISQIIIGAASGFFLGKIMIYVLNKVNIKNEVYYPIIVFTCCIFIFSVSYFIKGNPYLAIYIGGLIIGNSKFVEKRTTIKFFDAVSWLSQILMFLMLGLLVNPKELIPVAAPALIIGLFIIFVSRPLSVFICLAPFRKITIKDKLFISWVGLRGAVPIIFAILPLTAGIPHARFIFNVVFFITLLSILLQGTFLSHVAQWLGLILPNKKEKKISNLNWTVIDDIDSFSTEIEVLEYSLRKGNRLMDMPLPEDALVVMVKRGDHYFVPKGKTELKLGDKLLIMMNDEDTLNQIYDSMGAVNQMQNKDQLASG